MAMGYNTERDVAILEGRRALPFPTIYSWDVSLHFFKQLTHNSNLQLFISKLHLFPPMYASLYIPQSKNSQHFSHISRVSSG
jgi:hypothetical protein